MHTHSQLARLVNAMRLMRVAGVETGKVPWWHSPASMLSGGWKPTVCEEVADDAGVSHHVYNGLSIVQGPNYALAKTLQVRL